MNIELLNAAKDFVIAEANKEGVLLQDIFGTQQKFKDAIIAMVITTTMEVLDITMPQAYDIVMGEGSYQTLLDDCWNELTN